MGIEVFCLHLNCYGVGDLTWVYIVPFFFIWGAIAMRFGVQLKILRGEIAFLPRLGGSTRMSAIFHSVGQNIRNGIILPPEFEGKPILLMISFSTCSICATSIEELLELNRKYGHIPYLCLIDQHPDEVMAYREKYQDELPLYSIDLQTFMAQFAISLTPAFLYINEQREIVQISLSARTAYGHYRENSMKSIAGDVRNPR